MADYQLKIRKTHTDKKDIDNIFPVNRSEDVYLSKIKNIEDATLPQNGDTLTDAIIKYTTHIKEHEKVIGDILDDQDSLEEEVNTHNNTLETHEEDINELKKRSDSMEENISNMGSNLSSLGTSLADLNVDVLNNEKKIQEVLTKSTNNEKELNELRELINSGSIGGSCSCDEFTEVTYDQIKSLFESTGEIELPEDENGEKVTLVEVTYEQIAEIFEQSNNED